MLVVIGDLIADIVVLGAGSLTRGTDNTVVIEQTRGGSAANVAAAAALDGAVRFIGSIGTDAAGDALAHGLEQAGVAVCVQRHGRTGSIVVLVEHDGERTMLTDRAAAADLGSISPEWLADASWVHAPLYGFTGERSRESILSACATAAVPVSLDLSSIATMHLLGIGTLQAIVDRLSPSIVFANADEALLADEFALSLPAGATFVIKHGAEPVEVRRAGTTVHFAVPPVAVIDTTGAGDAFAAGYLQGVLRGDDIAQCAAAATARAQRALGKPGAL